MKIGIIGCGLIGIKRAECFNKKDIYIASDINLETLNNFKKKFKCKTTTEYKNVIKSNVDIVFICTPHNLLSKIAIEALKHKKHVFIEKPGSLDHNEVKKIRLLSKKYKLKVKIGFNHRYHPSIILAKKIIKNNNLGKILYLKGSYGHGGRKNYEKEWRLNHKISGGGELIDQGSHLIDLSIFFLGKLKLNYSFLKDYFWKKNIDDNIFISLISDKKQIAWLNASWTNWKNSFSFEIIFEYAKIKIHGLGRSYGVESLYFYKMKKNLKPPKEKIYKFNYDNSWKIEVKEFLDEIKKETKNQNKLDEFLNISEIIRDAYTKNLNKINFNYK